MISILIIKRPCLKFPIISRVILCFIIVMTFIPNFALSEETYVFERMWPALQQPWYFSYPQGIATDSNGNVYIADTNNDRVVKLSGDGKFLTEWKIIIPAGDPWATSSGRPYEIAIDSKDFLYVSCYYFFVKYTVNGDFVASFGEDFSSQGDADGEFRSIYGIALDENDYIYVVDSGNDRIQKFTSDGQFVTKWGQKGTADGEFDGPHGVAIDNGGNVYVSDPMTNRIQKFTSDGQFITKWEGQYECTGCLKGLAIDDNDFVYVGSNNQIEKYTSNGSFVSKWESDTALGARDSSFALTIDSNNNVYSVFWKTGSIVKITTDWQFIAKWVSVGNEEGKFNFPTGITMDTSGYIYVGDLRNGRIQKFTSDGQFVAEYPANGPYDIAIDSNENIYVANWDGIDKYNSNGEFVATFGTSGSGDGQFYEIESIALDDGYLYVADRLNHRIQKLSLDGQFVTKWGSQGDAEGEFNRPTDVALDSSGNVYVADTKNHRIQKFTSDGNFIKQWGTSGSGDGELSGPHGISIDYADFVYVSDSWNNRIQKFTKEGQFVTKFGERGFGAGQLNYLQSSLNNIQGICAGDNNKVYISDPWNNRIQVFKKVTSVTNSKSIIVAGGGAFPGNNLWDASQLNANFAYRTLTYQGFTKETIHYLTSDTDLDLDNNGILDDVDADATSANLQNAITTWATDTDNLVIYLVDHGGDGTFRMSGNETLSVSILDSWLDQLQTNTSCKVTIIIDACESGSFISQLTPPAGRERIILTSTSPGESAYFVSQGSISFSNYFWTHVFNGLNIKEAFDLAAGSIAFTTDFQTPLIDDNSNGIGNEAGDGLLAQNTFIGNGTIIHGDAPVIGSVSPAQNITDTNSAQLFAENVTDADSIARVWATVRSPDYTQGSTYNTVQELPSFDLMPVDNNRWEATWDGFSNPGTYYVSIYARDGIGNTSVPQITTVSVNNPLRHKAVIIASSWQSDTLWPAIGKNALLAYNALKFQGYADDDIYVMSSQTISGITVDGDATKSNLISVLNTWAPDSAQDLVLYMVVNGNHKSFRINQIESVSADELDVLLDNLQAVISGKVTVIYDACRSESFLSSLSSPTGKERILISSASSDQPARFLSNGDLSFSRFFWSQVLNGADVYKAFVQAKNAMWFLSNGDQVAHLDDNSNGIGNEKSDGQIARYYTLGTGIMLAGDDPLIGSVSPEQSLSGESSASIWAQNVTTTGTIDKVWAVITPPGDYQIAPDVPVIDLPSITLIYNSGTGKYEGTYTDFTSYGTYEISVYAMDTEGNISMPSPTSVIQTIGPDIYEDDDAYARAGIIIHDYIYPQVHNFHDEGDEDWVRFYAVSGQPYTIKTDSLGSSCDTVVIIYGTDGITPLTDPLVIGDDNGYGIGEEFSWNCPADGIYYVRVTQYIPAVYGENTEYELNIFHPVAGMGLLVGRVVDGSGSGIGNAIIRSNIGNAGTISFSNGYYILYLVSGTHTLTVTASGYPSATLEGAVVVDGNQANQSDVVLTVPPPVVKGDINNDGVANLTDAIIALKVLAGVDVTGEIRSDYVSSGVDVDGDDKAGLAEVIYAIQVAAGIR